MRRVLCHDKRNFTLSAQCHCARNFEAHMQPHELCLCNRRSHGAPSVLRVCSSNHDASRRLPRAAGRRLLVLASRERRERARWLPSAARLEGNTVADSISIVREDVRPAAAAAAAAAAARCVIKEAGAVAVV